MHPSRGVGRREPLSILRSANGNNRARMATMGQMTVRTRIFCWMVLLGAGTMSWGPALPSRGDDEGERFWSFQPVRAVAPPAVRDQDWPQTPVDPFVLAGLEEKGLRPAARADRRTLLRRATFDLTGLPPTPE